MDGSLQQIAIHFPSASVTKSRVLHIRIMQGIGEVHHALRVRAVLQPVGVTQFVDRFFDRPFPEEPVVRRQAVELGPQTMQCNDSSSAPDVRQPEDEVHAGCIEIDFGNTEGSISRLRRRHQH